MFDIGRSRGVIQGSSLRCTRFILAILSVMKCQIHRDVRGSCPRWIVALNIVPQMLTMPLFLYASRHLQFLALTLLHLPKNVVANSPSFMWAKSRDQTFPTFISWRRLAVNKVLTDFQVWQLCLSPKGRSKWNVVLMCACAPLSITASSFFHPLF